MYSNILLKKKKGNKIILLFFYSFLFLRNLFISLGKRTGNPGMAGSSSRVVALCRGARPPPAHPRFPVARHSMPSELARCVPIHPMLPDNPTPSFTSSYISTGYLPNYRRDYNVPRAPRERERETRGWKKIGDVNATLLFIPNRIPSFFFISFLKPCLGIFIYEKRREKLGSLSPLL